MPRQKICTRLASSLVRAPNSWSGGHEFNPRQGQNLERLQIIWKILGLGFSDSEDIFKQMFSLYSFSQYFLTAIIFCQLADFSQGFVDTPVSTTLRGQLSDKKWHFWVRFIRSTTSQDSPLSVETTQCTVQYLAPRISDTRECWQSSWTFFIEELSKKRNAWKQALLPGSTTGALPVLERPHTRLSR